MTRSPRDCRIRVDLFGRLGNTKNFEAVLGALLTANTVAHALGLEPATLIPTRYASLQAALVAAVHRVHVPWKLVPKQVLLEIRAALKEYQFVFSTNYDLLVYWAVMADTPNDFVDFFWGDAFDVSNTKVWNPATRVFYVHGGLHLCYDSLGRTVKQKAKWFENLLDLFGTGEGLVPLCVTEGAPHEKMSAIARSDYLAFCYQSLGTCEKPLVVLGHSLGDSDKHLAEAIRRGTRKVAVGIYPVTDEQVIKEKAHFVSLLPSSDLRFFDSRSHPLASMSLNVG